MTYNPHTDPAHTHPDAYERRVQELEAEGMTRSDAQGVASAEEITGNADWLEAQE